jgi:hypothetical protein
MAENHGNVLQQFDGNIGVLPAEVKNYPGSFSKWWTPVTVGMYIVLDLAQKLKETLRDKR